MSCSGKADPAEDFKLKLKQIQVQMFCILVPCANAAFVCAGAAQLSSEQHLGTVVSRQTLKPGTEMPNK